jgi:hypothetical protein
VNRELVAEAIRGFFAEQGLPGRHIDAWTDEIMRIIEEHPGSAP